MDIVLALGGGGSRGHAHIGVLRRLEQEGFIIRAVAGTSAGGIIAAAYAAGYTPDELESAFTKLDQSKLFGRSAKDGPGILGLSGAEKILEDFLGNRTFESLRMPCAVVAVDINTGQEIVLNQGRVVDAVLATIAVPGIFPPQIIGERQLVDGGVLDPVPVSVARSLSPKLPVIAVVLTPPVESSGRKTHIPLPVPIPATIVERLTRTRVAQAFTIFLQAVDAGGRMVTELRLKSENPDVIIRPEVNGIGLLDSVNVHTVVMLGEKATNAVLPELKKAVSWPSKLRRTIFSRKA